MDTDDDHEPTRAALAQAQRISATAAAAAQRSLRRSWLALGAALAIGFPGAAFVTHLAHGRWPTWVLAAVSFATVAAAMQITGIVGRRSPVRADPHRRRGDVIAALCAIAATGVLAGAAGGFGENYVLAYPLAALGIFLAWALAAWRA